MLCRRKRSTSSSSASETVLLLLFPMMLSMVKPEPLAAPALIGDLLLIAGSSVAVADSAGLGDLSLSALKAGNGGKSGASPFRGCGCGGGGGGM